MYKIDVYNWLTAGTKMPKTIIKLKKPALNEPEPVQVTEPVLLPEPVVEKKKTIIKLKKPLVLEQEPEKKKTIIKLKKTRTLPIPPPPAPGSYITKAMEAFEAIREYYTLRGQDIPDEDIKWYQEELVQEKKEMDEFWERCGETKANMEGVLRGDDDWTISLAVNAARQKVKTLPIQESDIGPMPDYGTKDFWAWCHKRKKLKEQKEAAIIAAGGVVKKPKKPVKKQEKSKETE